MELLDYLKWAVEEKASDLFIVPGAPVSIKKKNRIVPFASGEKVLPDVTAELIGELYKLAKREKEMDAFLSKGDDDFSFAVPREVKARFRVNTYRQRGSLASVVRIVPFEIPNWEKQNIPPQVMALAKERDGMVLFTGTAGSGKSTTQACIIDQINHTREAHIITLEDPIEYLHQDDKSIISQREIAIDTENYPSALRACLRQAPNVILLGEMRDQETIHTAITAAETGHLVIATLHTKGAVNAIGRIVDTFPSEQQVQIRTQLAMVLQSVVSQQLLPGTNDEQVPAFEIMHVRDYPAIRRQIRDGMIHQIGKTIKSKGDEGMITMDTAIENLYKEGRITAKTAVDYADNEEEMRKRVGLL